MANGIVLVANIIIVNYLDTQAHSVIYEICVFVFASLVLSSLFYIVENYLPLLGYFHAYTDNFNLRFLLAIFAVTMIVLLTKLAMVTLEFELYPSIIDIYKANREQHPDILDDLLGKRLEGVSSIKRFSLDFQSGDIKNRSKVDIELIPVEILS